MADGSTISRTTYADLFYAIGTTFGVGDGSTTFRIPDIRGYGIVMASTTQSALQGLSRDTLGDIGTTTSHVQTTAELAAHSHTMEVAAGASAAGTVSSTSDSPEGSETTDSAGSSAAFNTLDPYIILSYIIKI